VNGSRRCALYAVTSFYHIIFHPNLSIAFVNKKNILHTRNFHSVIISRFAFKKVFFHPSFLVDSSSSPSLSKNNAIYSSNFSVNNIYANYNCLEMSSSSNPVVPFVAENLNGVRERISSCAQSNNRAEGSIRLVAVSKTKPVDLLVEAYEAGQRHFGENYAQELMSKCSEMPNDVRWHFIGPLQSNKAASLVKTVGLDKLACVETVHTMKLANKLDRACASWLEENPEFAAEDDNNVKLGIYLQVNTSGEESKSGLKSVEEMCSLAQEIVDNCPHLRVDGLMTIGAPNDYTCFDTLVDYRSALAKQLGLVDENVIDLSMGMSGDFEEAIARGATSIRVGSTIFGARDYSNKK